MNIKIACVGDNCIDAYNTGVEYPGGNPVNVAVYLKRYDVLSSYTGAVGNDNNGKILIEAVKNKGVDVSHIKILEGKTAVSQVNIINGNRVFGDYDEGVLSEFKLSDDDIDFLCSHNMVVSGIWGMIEHNLSDISKRCKTAFDFANKFNEDVFDVAIPHVNFAFFSYDEESKEDFNIRYKKLDLEPKDSEYEMLKEFMKKISTLGPEAVIITLGENGSLGYDKDNFYKCDIVPCDVVDTMGAGDSFIAGFIYGILSGESMPEAMHTGAKNSAKTIGYFGAW